MSRVKFGDVVKDVKINIDRLNNPYEYYVAGDHMDSEDLTIHRKGCFTTDDVGPAFIRVFKPGQILYGSRRTYLKKIAVADFEGVCANTTFVFETKDPHAFEQRLLPFIMLSKDFTTWSIAKSKGSTNPYVLFSDLADFEFELPPLEEQKVLVDKLWAAYRLKEAYKKLLVATDEMVKSQFIEMFGNPLSLNQKNELKRLGECCILNPRRPNIALCDTDKVSFIPMPAVSEDGYLVDMTDEEYGKVKKGFTYFENNDVLFAKITPCMENGKGAIVHGLTNGIGMGSTEFHVLRPINGISSPYWLLALTRMPIFRERAAKNMSGTGGQKRVSASYLDHFMVGLPAMEEQRRFEAIYRQADKSKFGDFKSQFIEMFGNPVTNTKGWKTAKIKDVAPEMPSKEQLSGKIWLLNLDMIESNTGRIIEKVYEDVENALSVQSFDEGNVLFSKLRPYLNKVVIPDEPGMATTELVPLRPEPSKLHKVFLSHLLRGNQFVNYANDIAGGTKMPRMPLTELRNFDCILPPMDKQLEFVFIAEQVDKSEFTDT
ncbi:restriction endonuclease subunit S [Bacteroides thetaiotaomicron]|nr:restriction endonuclease subunit S [Bacteroides thetaiotaomicron]MDC2206064.1 restriction endonuclease subunit S [Bacteroides thetaiotaomicron]MDC2211026.1 restriction endonuclease subunit S [Bacteroides thetaiotaomicron]